MCKGLAEKVGSHSRSSAARTSKAREYGIPFCTIVGAEEEEEEEETRGTHSHVSLVGHISSVAGKDP